MRSQLTPAANDALVAYAGRLAQTALTLDSPDPAELIERALTAMALVDRGNDFRDSMSALDGIWLISSQLKLSPTLFATAAEHAGDLRNDFLNLIRRRA